MMEMTLCTGGRRSEGGSRNITKQERKIISDKMSCTVAHSQPSPLNYFFALEYQLLDTEL